MTAATDSTIAAMVPDVQEQLATGWGRTEPASDTIAGNYLATLIDRLSVATSRTGGRSTSIPQADLFDMNSAYVFDNIAVCRGPLTDRELDEVAATAAEFFGRSSNWTLMCSNHRSDLTDHGLALLGHPPLMFRPRSDANITVPTELDIRPVDGSTLPDFESTLIEAYPLPAGSSAVAAANLASLRAWVGYVDGEPVATAGSHTAHGLTEVEWVSTRTAHRGRGYGAALTWQATVADPSVPAVLIATDDGRPVYERLGYVALTRFSMWAATGE